MATLQGHGKISSQGFIPKGDGQRSAILEIMDRSIAEIVPQLSPPPNPTLSPQVALLFHNSRPEGLPP